MPSCRGVREGSCRRRGLIRLWRCLSCACASDLIPASALPFGKVLHFSMVQLLLIRLSSMRPCVSCWFGILERWFCLPSAVPAYLRLLTEEGMWAVVVDFRRFLRNISTVRRFY